MIFDFLKGLKGLDVVYGPCTDAEELVKSKPYLSFTAARKSAELLAKFIYMAAHATALQELTFADVLSDYQVRQFINDRNVMDPRRRKYVEDLRSHGITVDPSMPELRHCFNLNDKFGVMDIIWKDHQFQLVGTFL